MVQWLACLAAGPGLIPSDKPTQLFISPIWGGQQMGIWGNLGKVKCGNMDITLVLCLEIVGSYLAQVQGPPGSLSIV